ncbi:hypothetical protein GA830_19770 (plasmid) [Mesorhizobium sp. NBSH29]|nr:hypothetical protein GA830_18385 [Mesorhizobium sp. NBSH29]QPC89060.1 hypothetical protein GA830_19770 [Mesorhizobium sp. NBSH29]
MVSPIESVFVSAISSVMVVFRRVSRNGATVMATSWVPEEQAFAKTLMLSAYDQPQGVEA